MSGLPAVLDRISEALEPHGIFARGIVSFGPDEGPLLADGSKARSVVLLGNLGGSMWPAFARWRRSYDGPDPLDTWSKQRIRPLAEELGATAYFPSDRPWQPFQQWAMKAEGLKPSPLGILIHPQYGLWHGYRGALGFPFKIETNITKPGHPCDTCRDKPCLTACPVAAIGLSGFDIAACRSHLTSESGKKACMTYGCLARNACPIGAQFRYPPEQLRFHMEALI
ncbi:4Fe-4S dicluster domain-containing protein [Rhizobium sp. YS-1r]|uniref:4Fe-4S dicluster domain-containing protein n=1 Tax=Rhizobium sp. YS-1r TaxID=1532558 RepID=UPI00050E89BD|nr:4Fe-4S dicluster domain-containing protein [Rhizobium sp. YS-1r]KGE00675.1 ferredoxin [Rhizobium sp. YS-1r]